VRELRAALESLAVPPLAGAVAVIIPTYNEAAAIGDVVAAIPRDIVGRIIVADGGSSDGTSDIARRAGAEVLDAGRGYGRACLMGAQAADDAEIIVFMDGDGADDPAFIKDMVAALRSGSYDFVIGSRARGQREPGSMGSHQLLIGLLAGALIKLFYGVRYTDMCAYRAIRRETLLQLGMRERTYGWNLEMQMRVARSRLRVLELPVAYRRRAGGESKVAGNLRGTIRAGSRIIATFARVAME
jgi:glycosyltransferase involved in cell wall biosynthesis